MGHSMSSQMSSFSFESALDPTVYVTPHVQRHKHGGDPQFSGEQSSLAPGQRVTDSLQDGYFQSQLC